MKRIVLLCKFLLALCASSGIAQNVLMTVTVSPDISPFISDWREDANSILVHIDNMGDADIPRAILHITVTGVRSGRVFEARSLEFSVSHNSSITLAGNGSLLDASSISYSGKIKAQVMETNRIPDDDYDICCDMKSLPDQKPITTSCSQFSIRAASAPLLISPADKEVVLLKYPIFQWLPSRTINRMEVKYRIMIRPLREFQTALQSMTSGTVDVFTKEDITAPNIQMTTDAIELEDGKSYVWQVQALDRGNRPLGENEGKSEVFQFTYQTPETMHQQMQQDSLKVIK
jgi:hypothetical protein